MDLKNKFLQVVQRIKGFFSSLLITHDGFEFLEQKLGAEVVSNLNERQKDLLMLVIAACEPLEEEDTEWLIPVFMEIVEKVEDEPKYSRQRSGTEKFLNRFVYPLIFVSLLILVVIQLLNSI